jgi:hypothetical protein
MSAASLFHGLANLSFLNFRSRIFTASWISPLGFTMFPKTELIQNQSHQFSLQVFQSSKFFSFLLITVI